MAGGTVSATALLFSPLALSLIVRPVEDVETAVGSTTSTRSMTAHRQDRATGLPLSTRPSLSANLGRKMTFSGAMASDPGLP